MIFILEVIAVYTSIFFFLSRGVTIRKTYVFLLLFFFWAIAYLYSPYWYAFGTFGFPNLRYGAFVFLLFLGILWAYLSSNDLKLPKLKIHLFQLFLLSTVLYIINLKQLYSDIAWRGDEDAHVLFLFRLKDYLTFFWQKADVYLAHSPTFWLFILLLFLTAFLLLFYRRKRSFRYLFITNALLLIALFPLILFSERMFADQKNTFLLANVLRYPYIQKWLGLLFIFPNFYDISLYRIIPFLSLLGITFFLYDCFYQHLQSKLQSMLFSLAFSTIPLLLFYSSILYLEMPFVFLMLFCVWNIEILIQEDIKKLLGHYVWYMLLIISFLKETIIIFLLAIVFLRMFYQLKATYKSKRISYAFLFSEMRFAFLILCPVITFILFRNIFSPFLNSLYSFYPSSILSIPNLIESITSLIFQTGILPILGVLGLVILGRKDLYTMSSLIVLFVSTIAFFIGYLHKDFMLIAGYSRYNLQLLPILLFTAVIFVSNIIRRKIIYAVVILLIIFSFNIIFFPFKSDGARLPNWGIKYMDIAEYIYPYDEAIHFLQNKKIKSMLVTGYYGLEYRGLRFYLEKYNMHPKISLYPFGIVRFNGLNEREMLDSFFKKVEQKKIDNSIILADTILYHSVNGIDLDSHIVYGKRYKIIKRIQNSLHSIYILEDDSYIR